MSVLGIVIKWILGLGAAIFVPIIIIIAGLIVGMKIKDAISAGITLGVAFTGMSMLIVFLFVVFVFFVFLFVCFFCGGFL